MLCSGGLGDSFQQISVYWAFISISGPRILSVSVPVVPEIAWATLVVRRRVVLFFHLFVLLLLNYAQW